MLCLLWGEKLQDGGFSQKHHLRAELWGREHNFTPLLKNYFVRVKRATRGSFFCGAAFQHPSLSGREGCPPWWRRSCRRSCTWRTRRRWGTGRPSRRGSAAGCCSAGSCRSAASSSDLSVREERRGRRWRWAGPPTPAAASLSGTPPPPSLHWLLPSAWGGKALRAPRAALRRGRGFVRPRGGLRPGPVGAALPRKTARVPLGRATMPSAGFPLHRSLSSLPAAEHTGRSARYLSGAGAASGHGPSGASHGKALTTRLKETFGKFASGVSAPGEQGQPLTWPGMDIFVYCYRGARDSEKELWVHRTPRPSFNFLMPRGVHLVFLGASLMGLPSPP